MPPIKSGQAERLKGVVAEILTEYPHTAFGATGHAYAVEVFEDGYRIVKGPYRAGVQ